MVGTILLLRFVVINAEETFAFKEVPGLAWKWRGQFPKKEKKNGFPTIRKGKLLY
jgi:hypothetical protein